MEPSLIGETVSGAVGGHIRRVPFVTLMTDADEET
jgi:hypothetical protein